VLVGYACDFALFLERQNILIEAIPVGSVVVVAVMDEAAHQAGADAYAGLKILGGATAELGYRDSYAMIGRRGGALGSAVECPQC
jgi:hypothetical protein